MKKFTPGGNKAPSETGSNTDGKRIGTRRRRSSSGLENGLENNPYQPFVDSEDEGQKIQDMEATTAYKGFSPSRANHVERDAESSSPSSQALNPRGRCFGDQCQRTRNVANIGARRRDSAASSASGSGSGSSIELGSIKGDSQIGVAHGGLITPSRGESGSPMAIPGLRRDPVANFMSAHTAKVALENQIPGFDQINNLSQLRRVALVSLINDLSDEDLISVLHLGASRARFWPLQLQTLAPIAKSLKEFAEERARKVSYEDKAPARRGWQPGDPVLRGLSREATRHLHSGSTSKRHSARHTPTQATTSLDQDPGLKADILTQRLTRLQVESGRSTPQYSARSSFLDDAATKQNHLMEFANAQSLCTVPRACLRIGGEEPRAARGLFVPERLITPQSMDAFSEPALTGAEDEPEPAQDHASHRRHHGETVGEKLDVGPNGFIFSGPKYDFYNDKITASFDGFDDDLRAVSKKEKKKLHPDNISHFYQKLIFHSLVIGISLFYGVQTDLHDLDDQEDRITVDSCYPTTVIARMAALSTTIWTTVLFATMNRRIMSLIGMLSPMRGRWAAWVFDGSVSFHKHAGWCLIFDSAVHSIAHMICTVPAIVGADATQLNNVFKCANPDHEGYIVKGLPFRGLTWPKCPFDESKTGGNFRGKEVWASWPALTGLIMIVLLVLLGYTARPAVRKRNWELFMYFHQFMIFAWPVLLFFHGVNQWLGVGIPLIFFGVIYPWTSYMLLDFFPRYFRMLPGQKLPVTCATINYGADDQGDPVKGSIVSIYFKREEGWGVCRGGWHPGQVAWLRVPKISRFEWHPFTIASGTNGQLRFCIQAVGDWTTELVRIILASENAATLPHDNSLASHVEDSLPQTEFPIDDLFASVLGAELINLEETGVLDHTIGIRFPDLEMSVDGPYRAPTITAIDPIFNAVTGAKVCFVATGIGITPFIAMLDAMIEDITNPRRKRYLHPDTEVHLYWMTRRVDDFLLALPAFRQIQESKVLQKHIFLHLHLTGLEKPSDDNAVFLLRWGIELHNQMLRNQLEKSIYAVPMPWLYPKPCDLMGLRYLAEEHSPRTAAMSFFNDGDLADCQHAVVLGRPDFAFEINLMGAMRTDMPVHVYCCATQLVQDKLERVIDTCNMREKEATGNRRRRFHFRYERFE